MLFVGRIHKILGEPGKKAKDDERTKQQRKISQVKQIHNDWENWFGFLPNFHCRLKPDHIWQAWRLVTVWNRDRCTKQDPLYYCSKWRFWSQTMRLHDCQVLIKMQQVISPPNYYPFSESTTVTHAAAITGEKRANLNRMNFGFRQLSFTTSVYFES